MTVNEYVTLIIKDLWEGVGGDVEITILLDANGSVAFSPDTAVAQIDLIIDLDFYNPDMLVVRSDVED